MSKILSIAAALTYSQFAYGNTAEKDFYYISESVEICQAPTELVHMPSVRGKPYFLKYYNNVNSSETYLTIVIWGRDLPDLEIDPASYFTSEDRCMSGNISSYRGQKQLVIRSQDQLTSK